VSAEDDEIVAEFLVESHENLDQLDRDLVALEQHPDSRELLSGIFRTIHTIKGTSGFLAFGRLEALTHVGENLLSRLRDGEQHMTPEIAEALLRMVDCVRALLTAIESSGADAEPAVDVDGAVDAIRLCLESAPVSLAAVAVDPAVEPAAQSEPEPAVEAVPEPMAEVAPEVDAEPLTESTVEASNDGAGRRTVADSTVRVDVDLLDTLVRLVGELVLTRNQILQQADVAADVDLARASQRLNLVASELQESVMKTRMQPIGQVWAKMPRVVRDLAAQLSRSVRLDMEGQETELDRSLLEAVKDPLTHLVRNAIDHGIEPPEVRIARGKPAEGLLTLRAYHESGQVVVEISDDGKGLDPAHLGAAAVQRGLITQSQLAGMETREIVDLIFRPGFSTAGAVTNVSGRGVGMDVVRTNIERIGGTVDLSGRPGHGTTVRVRIPLTLAIIPALVVGQGEERYAIPQANLVELVRLDAADQSRALETLAGAPVLRLRGHLLPLVPLSGALGVSDADRDVLTIVVLQSDDVRFGLSVADVHDTQEIVVKPLGRQLKGIPTYAGATIMGDGKVALILDVAGLAQSAGVSETAHRAEVESRAADGADISALIVLDLGDGRRAALPLAEVSRLEEFPAARVERSGLVEVVQYRDGILPLIHLADAIGIPRSAESAAEGATLSVIVHDSAAGRVGIVVDRVIDVVQTEIVPARVGVRPGVLGSAVVQDVVTDLVDLDAVVAAAGVTLAGAA
jgi:two-component system chemotaxis sensor kinase CheA